MGDKYTELKRFLKDMEEDNNSSSVLFAISISDYNARIKRFSIEKYYKVDTELFLKCLLTYSETLITYLVSEFPEPTLESKQFLKEFENLTSDVLDESIKMFNLFILNGSNKIFDIVSDAFHWSKNELLIIYNAIIDRFSDKISKSVIELLNPSLIYNLVDMLGPCGDYDFQAHLIETIYRLFDHKYLKQCMNRAKFFPESNTLDKSFINIDLNNFDENVRRFLMEFNDNGHNVYSTCCESIRLGDFACEKPPTVDEFYMDYNLGSKSLSWYCLANNLLANLMTEYSQEDNSWTLMRVFVNDIQEMVPNKNVVVIKLKPTGTFRSNFEDLEILLKNEKILKLTLKDNKNAHILTGNLKRSSAKTFDKVSVKMSTQRKRPLYKPLNVKISNDQSVKSIKTTGFTNSLFNSSNNSIRIDSTDDDEIIEISSDSSCEFEYEITKTSTVKSVNVQKVSTWVRNDEKSSSESEVTKISKLVILSGNCSENNNKKSDSLSDDIMRIDNLSQFDKNETKTEEINIKTILNAANNANSNQQVANVANIVNEIVENNSNVNSQADNEEKMVENDSVSLKTNENFDNNRILSQSMSIEDENLNSETPTIIQTNEAVIYSKKFLEKFDIKQFHINLTRLSIDESVQKSLSQAIKLSFEANETDVDKKSVENVAKPKKFTHNLSRTFSRSRSASPLRSNEFISKEKLPILYEEREMSPILNKNTNSDKTVHRLMENDEKMEIVVEKFAKQHKETDLNDIKENIAPVLMNSMNKSVAKRRLYDPEDITYLEDVVTPSTGREKKKRQVKTARRSLTKSVLSIKTKKFKNTTVINGKKKRKSRYSFVNELNDESELNCLVNVKKQSFPFNNNRSMDEMLKIACKELYPKYNRCKTIEANSKIKIHSNILLNPPPLNDENNSINLITVEENRIVDIITMCLQLVPSDEMMFNMLLKTLVKLKNRENNSWRPENREALLKTINFLQNSMQ